MDAILTKIHLGITFCEPCIFEDTKNVVGYKVAGVMRYTRITKPRTEAKSYDIGWDAQGFIDYYIYLGELQNTERIRT